MRKIFVVGNSRNGTKLLGRCLGLHSQIYTLHETHFFDEMVSSPYERIKNTRANKLLKKLYLYHKIDMRIPDNFNDNKKGIIAHELYNQFQQDILKYKNKTIVCDTTPRNLFYVKELKVIYPDAFFIVLNRDLRAVLWSQKNKWKLAKISKWINRFELLRTYFNYHPITTSFIWKKSIKEVKKLTEELCDKVFPLKFEDFIRNPQNILKKITAGCEVEFEKEMLKVRVINTSDLNKKNTIGFDKSRIDAWKQNLSKTDIWIAQKMCKKEMQHLGYSLVKTYPNMFVLIVELVLLPVHFFISFFLNVIRAWRILFFLRKKIFRLSEKD